MEREEREELLRIDSKDVILAGDVGGTNSRFMLYTVNESMELDAGKRPTGTLVFKKQYLNEGVSSLTVQLKQFLIDSKRTKSPPVAACLAVAGPVIDNKADMSNRNWSVDGENLQRELGIKEVKLVNDFVAAGYGLLTLDLDSSEVRVINRGKKSKNGPIACLGSGTGLGETFLTPSPETGEYTAYPTEGGHTALAPRSSLENEMIVWLKSYFQLQRISVERVVSGLGLAAVYEFLSHKFPERIDKSIHEKIMTAGDMKGMLISEGAKVQGSLCEQTLQIWASHYGCEAGAVCLKYFPLGGLFIAGGMTPKLIDWIVGEDSLFMKSFRDQGRVSHLLDNIPIYAVMEDDIGQRGAHYVAFTIYKKEVEKKRKLQLQRGANPSAS